jgi:hypothetical protein
VWVLPLTCVACDLWLPGFLHSVILFSYCGPGMAVGCRGLEVDSTWSFTCREETGMSC